MQRNVYFYEKKFASMFNYTPQNQLDIFNFKIAFESLCDCGYAISFPQISQISTN